MIKLLKNITLYRDGEWKASQMLIADKRIAQVADKIECQIPDLEVIDCGGMRGIPGYIDQHVHITGGGGEGGFSNQVPPLKFCTCEGRYYNFGWTSGHRWHYPQCGESGG